MAQRQWTETEKAAILAWFEANKRNLRKTARQFGVAPMTLHGWTKGRGLNKDVRKDVQEKIEALDKLWEQEVRAALTEAGVVRDTARYGELVTAAAIGTDKMQLLRKLPTSINEERVSVEDKRRALREFLLNDEECQPSAILN